ncbi:MAG: glycerophosphodiester phosphodiesterase [Actinobacteria bacterium]|nr:glycerophosphodiester phosphodiesterase [Actinomycetota bacterium]NDA37458.1 glycerophosphodiester phosphodiesterase [Acidimicrobiia bacterium]NDB41809.1 glycerophosphodiester phosphodiesterase [Actinomycetota bacterium]NDF66535.1 glycerophosphodiester phosphodiesterase [Actinomycetota bacterium]
MGHPFLKHATPLAFAHRGGASDAPENTMPAFQRAIDLGYIYIETDVHATKDGVLLAFHDDDLSRTCNRPGLISELNFEEVKDARVNGSEPIPLLEDLISAWPHAHLNIDCKSDQALAPLADRIARGDIFDRICIGSFSDRRLNSLREQFGKRLCTSMGPRDVTKLRLGSWVRRSPSFENIHAAQVPISQGPLTIVDQSFVRSAHNAEIQVHVWTIDDEDEMIRLLDLGVDGIMTDKPETLKKVLVSRNAWHGR